MIPTPATAYRSDIDGVRALAVAAVVLWHAGLGVPHGYLGVDVFFVVSGYLMARIWERGPGLGDFALRRARRILPMLFVTIAGSLLAGAAILPPSAREALSREALLSLAQVGNIAAAFEDSYWSDPAKLRPLLHLWTVGLEVQFYILCAGVFVMLRRRRMFAWSCLGAASLALALWTGPAMPELAFYTLPFRLWEFAAGVVLGLGLGSGDARVAATRGSRVEASWFWWTGLALVIVPMMVLPRDFTHPGPWTLPTVAGAVAMIAAGARAPGWWLSRPVRWLGLASFSVYLLHQPLFAFARHLRGEVDLPVPWAVALIGLTLALAALTHRVVETPLRRPRGPVARRAPLALGVVAALTAAGLVRTPEGTDYDLDPQRWIAERDGRLCINRSSEPGCVLGDGDAVPTIALLGDSHLQAMTGGWDEALRARGLAAMDYTLGGCPVLLGVERVELDRDCAIHLEWALADMRSRGLRGAVVMDRAAGYATGTVVPPRAGMAEEVADFRLRLGAGADELSTGDVARLRSRTLAQFAERGMRVAWILPLPELGVHVPDAVGAALSAGTRPPSIPRRAHDERGRALASSRGMAAGLEAVAVFDPADALCDRRSCPSVRDGELLYTDYDHPSRTATRAILDDLADPVLAHVLDGGAPD